MSKTPKKRKTWKVTPLGKHVKNLVHERIVILGNQVWYEKWLFRRIDFICGLCKKTEDVVFMRLRPLNAVVRSCTFCGFTEVVQPTNPDNPAEELAYRIIDDCHTVTVSEAWKHLKRWGQPKRFRPQGLPLAGRRGKRDIPSPEEIDLE